MVDESIEKLPPWPGAPPPLQGHKQELADAFSGAVFGLLDHPCTCPSAKFVRLLVKYRNEAFKGGEASGESFDIKTD